MNLNRASLIECNSVQKLCEKKLSMMQKIIICILLAFKKIHNQ